MKKNTDGSIIYTATEQKILDVINNFIVEANETYKISKDGLSVFLSNGLCYQFAVELAIHMLDNYDIQLSIREAEEPSVRANGINHFFVVLDNLYLRDENQPITCFDIGGAFYEHEENTQKVVIKSPDGNWEDISYTDTSGYGSKLIKEKRILYSEFEDFGNKDTRPRKLISGTFKQISY